MLKKMAGGGGDGSGIASAQSDFSQNDSTKPDYIKNRPCFIGEKEATEVFPETSLTFAEMNGGLVYIDPQPSFVPTEGDVYKICFDDDVYDCTCLSFHGIPVIGNASMLGEGENTEEPFIIAYQSPNLIIASDSGTTHSISIDKIVTPITEISEKFLPKATEDSLGICKTPIRKIEDKDYNTDEISKIVQAIENGEAIYIYGNHKYGSASLDYQKTQATFYEANSQSYTVKNVNGIWNFADGKYNRDPIINYMDYYNGSIRNMRIEKDTFDGFSNSRDLYYAFCTAGAANGFRGEYIQADGELLLKYENNTKYLHVYPDANGKICIYTSDSGVGNTLNSTTIFKNEDDSIILSSSTENSTKKFKITVDDTGTLSATEVT